MAKPRLPLENRDDVSLRAINGDNFRECINLKVAEGQEMFVAPNVYSIAQSKIFPTLLPMAIYAGDEMVGFVLYGLDPDDSRYYLGRLMIAEQHQGRGYGRAATLAVIGRLREVADCREIYLSFVPRNKGAEKLYLEVGFEKTGEITDDGEIIMRYQMKNAGNRPPVTEH